MNICDLKTDDFLDYFKNMLPKGRIWQLCPNTSRYDFWLFMAKVFHDINRDICDAFKGSYICQDATDIDLWAQEYGIPEPCYQPICGIDSTLDVNTQQQVCAKIQISQTATLDFYQNLAMGFGLNIKVYEHKPDHAPDIDIPPPIHGPDGSILGDHQNRDLWTSRNTLWIEFLDKLDLVEALAGCFKAGHPLCFNQKASIFRCFVDRYKPAHLNIEYVN